MSLLLADASTDNVNFGAAASLDDIQEGTLCVQIFPTSTANSSKAIASKTDATGTLGWFLIKFVDNGTTLLFLWNRATTDLSRSSLANTLIANNWYRITTTWSISGNTASIYSGGTSGSPMTNVSSTLAGGSGAIVTDALSNFCAGNTDGGSLGWPGNEGAIAVFASVLTQAQFESWHGLPRAEVDGIVAKVFARLGSPNNQAGTQIDESGNGNNGAVTGATVGIQCPMGFVARIGNGRAGERHALLVG